MSALPPPIPADMSSGGEAVWDWADRMSRFTQDNARRSQLTRDLAVRSCGGCRSWMTKGCRRERPGGTSGRSTGPAASDAPCSDYVEKTSTTRHRDRLRAELASLEQRIG